MTTWLCRFFVLYLHHSPLAGRYDCIWAQWVLGHLTDDDLVAFFIRFVREWAFVLLTLLHDILFYAFVPVSVLDATFLCIYSCDMLNPICWTYSDSLLAAFFL